MKKVDNEKIEFVANLIDKLEKLTNNLFSEVMDFNIRTYYKSKNLLLRIKKYKELHAELSNHFDMDVLKTISITLDNCDRILNARIKKINDNLDDFDLASANGFISSYIEGKIAKESLFMIPSSHKQLMLSILKESLNSNSDDLYELLELVKKKEEENLKII